MTRRVNSSVAGVAFLLYIAVGIFQMVALGGTTEGDTAAERLATLARQAGVVHADAVLSLLTCLFALVLAVTLHALTREVDPDLALLGLACRFGEALAGPVHISLSLGLLAYATSGGEVAPDLAGAQPLLTVLLGARPWNVVVAATFFAAGSTLFSWLLLRGRIVPVVLGRLGVASSALLLVALPLRLGDLLPEAVAMAVWLPMLVFEVWLAIFLTLRGAAAPRGREARSAAAPPHP